MRELREAGKFCRIATRKMVKQETGGENKQ